MANAKITNIAVTIKSPDIVKQTAALIGWGDIDFTNGCNQEKKLTQMKLVALKDYKCNTMQH